MTMRIVDREISPRTIGNTDYGADGKVIIRNQLFELIRRGGFNAWHGIGSTQYRKARFVLYDIAYERKECVVHTKFKI